MATSKLAYAAEKAVGHGEETTKQDVSNYRGSGDSSETMKALVWQGKKSVTIGSQHTSCLLVGVSELIR